MTMKLEKPTVPTLRLPKVLGTVNLIRARFCVECTPMIGNFGADCTDLTLTMHAVKNKKAV
ncbi:unnamed protein product, partial [Callosobruchus maculatus]